MAALTLSPAKLHRASEGVRAATKDLYAVLKEHAAARYVLDEARAQLLVSGVDGKNAEVRDAQLRITLAGEFERLERASVKLSDQRGALECARAVWDCLRYEVRLLEITAADEVPF